MLLRTSSNPIVQSILSSAFPDSPKRELLASAASAASSFGTASAAICRQISCPRFGSPNIIRKHIKRSNKEFRRALSDSNLETLVCSSSDHSCDTQDNQFAHRFQGFHPDTYNNNNNNNSNNINMLETAPSLSSIFNSVQDGAEDPTSVVVLDGLGEIGMLADLQVGLERTVTIGDKIEDVIGADFPFARSSMGSIVEEEGEGEPEEEEEDEQNLDRFDPPSSPPMYLATGLGVDPISCDLLAWNFKSGKDLEEHYRTMVEEFPSHPLLLRNYAELLKEKGDLNGAEKYYLQATLADPKDGAILSQYAKLVWELHADRERAEEYFEKAVQVAPQDCHVFAAYASFLWETEDNSEEPSKLESNLQVLGKEEENIIMDDGCNIFRFDEAQISVGTTLRLDDGLGDGSAGVGGGNSGSSAAMGGPSGDASLEQYYRRRVEENPYNPLVLGNYAHFLYQSKGDLKGAEEYYNRALLLDQSDGDVLSHYAKLVWELHGDKDRAQNYFDRAVKTAPGNSHVLAAYASFLWATGSEDEDEEDPDGEEVEAIQLPCVQIPMSQGILTAPRA